MHWLLQRLKRPVLLQVHVTLGDVRILHVQPRVARFAIGSSRGGAGYDSNKTRKGVRYKAYIGLSFYLPD